MSAAGGAKVLPSVRTNPFSVGLKSFLTKNQDQITDTSPHSPLPTQTEFRAGPNEAVPLVHLEESYSRTLCRSRGAGPGKKRYKGRAWGSLVRP
jgi:hypothetical protein